MNRTHEILSGVFGIPMATGTISNIVGRFSDGLITTIQGIRDKLTAADVANFDETGNCEMTRVDLRPSLASIRPNRCLCQS